MTFRSFNAEYVRRLKDGDAEVENEFASYFGDLLYLKLRARLRSQQLIEDIRQETLMRVLEILRTKGGIEYPERFGAFVNSVCNNVLLEFCRSEGRHDAMDQHQEEQPDTSVDMDRPLVNFDRKRQVERVLRELPEKDRSILKAVYLDETEKAEICRRHHVDADYLRVLLHRAKSRFRRIYLDQGGGATSSIHA